MRQRRGYVLVAVLYVVAVLSISSLLLVRTASLMAGEARLLDHRGSLSREAHRLLRLSEAQLPDTRGQAITCEQTSDLGIAIRTLHERLVSRLSEEGEVVSAHYRIYGLLACAEGRALMETTVGVIDPKDAFAAGHLPSDVELGRLSWREVW